LRVAGFSALPVLALPSLNARDDFEQLHHFIAASYTPSVPSESKLLIRSRRKEVRASRAMIWTPPQCSAHQSDRLFAETIFRKLLVIEIYLRTSSDVRSGWGFASWANTARGLYDT
jgi:hypothetical protein